jgi:hypothetical protein
MLCHYCDSAIDTHPGIGVFCSAKAMQPRQREGLALQALTGEESIRGLAAQHAVSRKFIYQQMDTAKDALQEVTAGHIPGEPGVRGHQQRSHAGSQRPEGPEGTVSTTPAPPAERRELCRPTFALTNQGDYLLAFAAQLDQDLAGLAHRFQLPVATLREVFNNAILDGDRPERWTRDADLRQRLGSRFYAVSMAVAKWPRIPSVPVP